jgi:hypothetical protein
MRDYSCLLGPHTAQAHLNHEIISAAYLLSEYGLQRTFGEIMSGNSAA